MKEDHHFGTPYGFAETISFFRKAFVKKKHRKDCLTSPKGCIQQMCWRMLATGIIYNIPTPHVSKTVTLISFIAASPQSGIKKVANSLDPIESIGRK